MTAFVGGFMLSLVGKRRLPRFSFFEMLRTPFYRRELRAASGGGRLLVMVGLAVLLDATATLGAVDRIQRALDGGQAVSTGEVEMISIGALSVVSLLLMLLAVGYAASGWAGEKEQGTAEALVLTPLSRPFLVWTKLLARSRPLRCFMLAAVPAFLAFGLIMLADSFGPVAEASESSYQERLTWGLIGALIVGALLWVALTCQLHAVAVITLYFSARAEESFMAGMWGALVGVVLPLALTFVTCCCFGYVLPVYYLGLAAFMLIDLTNRLDLFLIGE